MKPSILRRLNIAFLLLGLAMGLIFPVYASFFVEFNEGMQVWFNLGCVVSGVLIGIINYYMVKLILLKKLERVADVVDAVQKQDISFKCVIKSDDIIGHIVGSFNLLVDSLRDVISHVNASSNTLTGAARELKDCLQGENQQLQAQSQAMEHVSGVMDEMAEAIQNVATYTNEATEAAQLAEQHSARGHQVVTQTMTTINDLAGEVKGASDTIEKLGLECNNIGSVLDVIRGIAEQTNLLALNAAIEAARAGESGRGFAVVADEVRALAGRSHTATQEIQNMIECLQQGASDAEAAMASSRSQAQTSVKRVEETQAALQAISDAVSGIVVMNQKIDLDISHQHSSSEELSSTLQQVTEAAEHIVISADQQNQSSEQLSILADELHAITQQFKLK